jgi:hypothetical protein
MGASFDQRLVPATPATTIRMATLKRPNNNNSIQPTTRHKKLHQIATNKKEDAILCMDLTFG